jgi:hypothetical protein
MRILLDECLPRKLKFDFAGHDLATVPEIGWRGLENGELLRRAATAFDAHESIDQGLTYQQNLQGSELAIILFVAPDSRLETLRPLMPQVLAALDKISSGEIIRITT